MIKAETTVLSVIYLTEVVRSSVLGAIAKFTHNQLQEIFRIRRPGLRVDTEP